MKKFLVSLIALSFVFLFSNSAFSLDDTQNATNCKKNNTKCANFLDANNDGVCDKFVDANNDGKCDNSAQNQNCQKGKGKGKCGKGMMNGKKKNCGNKNACSNTDQSNIKSLDVYPNPSSISTNVKFELIQNSAVEVQISDMSGVIIKSIKMGSFNAGVNEFIVDLSGINAGNYYLSVIGGKSRLTKQIIVN